MNSVMDDNKVLTLSNSDRIVMYGHMRMLLEIRDLRFATPATVSRGGVIYIQDAEGWQWRSQVEAWLIHPNNKLNEQMKKGNISEDKQKEVTELLRSFLFTKYLPKMLDVFKRSFKRPFPVCDISLVTTTCNIFDAIYDGSSIDRLNYIEQWFALSAIWGFGASVSLQEGEDFKKSFSRFFMTEYKGVLKMNRTVYDQFLDSENEFTEWSEILKETPFDSSTQSITQVVVDTAETTA